MYDLRVSMSVIHPRTISAEYLDSLVMAGFKNVDFDLCCDCAKDLDYQMKNYVYLERGLENLIYKGIEPTGCHISFGTYWDLSAQDEDMRLQSLKRTLEMIERLKGFGIKNFIIHGNGWDFSKDRDRAEGIKKLRDSLFALSEVEGPNVALESLPRTCLGNTSEELLEIIDGTNIKICLDTNHFLKEKPEDAILKLGKKIVSLHISDYDGIDEKHWLPKKGINDWNKIIASLEKIGYDGTFNYEANVRDPTIIAENKKQLFEEYNLQRA